MKYQYFDCVISITDTIPTMNYRLENSLVLDFDDILWNVDGFRAFSEDDAVTIREFALKNIEKSILVNCRHGASRSAAVAFAILCIMRGVGSEVKALNTMLSLDQAFLPNRRVIHICDHVLGRKGVLITTIDDWYERQPWFNEIEQYIWDGR
ncbi:hypothetical protein MJD09_25695 [bacterium]|nr:hypothetical protein [bacterium]